MAGSAPQLPPPPVPYQQGWAPTPPPAPKSRTALYAVIGIVVVVVLIIALLVVSGVFSPKTSSSSSSGPKTATYTQNLINTNGQSFGPGLTNAAVISFTIPSTAIHAWVNGTFAVTGCTALGNYCLANVNILTPSAWSNLQSGGTVNVIWCVSVGSNSCQAEQNVQISTPDLVGYAGQTLDLVLYSNATTESQSFSADVNFIYMTSG